MAGFAAFRSDPLASEPCTAVGVQEPGPLAQQLQPLEPFAWPVAVMVVGALVAWALARRRVTAA